MPRLNKGEISPGVQAKTDAARQSALCRVEYFQNLQRQNNLADDAWLGFKSIENLSLLSIPELGIEPISPKTLRKHMLSMYEGEFPLFWLMQKILGTSSGCKFSVWRVEEI